MSTGFTGNFVGQDFRYNRMTLFTIFDGIKRNDAACAIAFRMSFFQASCIMVVTVLRNPVRHHMLLCMWQYGVVFQHKIIICILESKFIYWYIWYIWYVRSGSIFVCNRNPVGLCQFFVKRAPVFQMNGRW